MDYLRNMYISTIRRMEIKNYLTEGKRGEKMVIQLDRDLGKTMGPDLIFFVFFSGPIIVFFTWAEKI